MADAFLTLAVAGTLAMVTFVPFPDAVRAIAFGLVIAGATFARDRLRAPLELTLDCNRAIAVRDAGGWTAGAVRDGSFVAPWLAIVRWRPHGARFDRSLVIVPDMIAAEAHRMLRVILRWG